MASSFFYVQRKGECVYEVTVAKDEMERLSRRYRAHLNNAERIENGRLASVYVDVPDTYGPTVSEAMRALDALFEMWQLVSRPRSPVNTEGGDAPGAQGARRAHTGSMQPTSNAAPRDAAPAECNRTSGTRH